MLINTRTNPLIRNTAGFCYPTFRYFTLFKNLLNECTEGQELEQKSTKASHVNKLNALRNATIQAMSNLLSANIDSGLMHSISLGYHPDLQTRAAFMEVSLK